MKYRFKIRAIGHPFNNYLADTLSNLKDTLSDPSFYGKSISIEHKSASGMKGVDFITINETGLISDSYSENPFSFDKLDQKSTGYYEGEYHE